MYQPITARTYVEDELKKRIMVAFELDSCPEESKIHAYDKAVEMGQIYSLAETLNAYRNTQLSRGPGIGEYGGLQASLYKLVEDIETFAGDITKLFASLKQEPRAVPQTYYNDISKKITSDIKKELVLIAPNYWLPSLMSIEQTVQGTQIVPNGMRP